MSASTGQQFQLQFANRLLMLAGFHFAAIERDFNLALAFLTTHLSRSKSVLNSGCTFCASAAGSSPCGQTSAGSSSASSGVSSGMLYSGR
jgi:hypothetical protein